jgi:uncharacterized protein (DUF2147 family)
MDRIKSCLIALLCLVGSFAILNVQAETFPSQSPIGYWKNVDTATGKTKSIIQIWQAEDNTLQGKVIKTFPKVNTTSAQAIGTVILSGLMAHENQWNGGKIVDPENGKTYQCSLNLAENGKKLNVRGYIGIPILGHSQTWERVDLMSDFENIHQKTEIR